MENKSIIASISPKRNINKQKILKVSKVVLGLFALSVCFKAGFGCSQRSYQQKQEAAEHDKTIMGVLTAKKITEKSDNKNHVIFWLDTNNDPQTSEGFCHMPDADAEKTSHISSLTNGTTMSLSEWKKVAHPYEVQHNPCEFLRSR